MRVYENEQEKTTSHQPNQPYNTPLPESTIYTHLRIGQSGDDMYPFNSDDVKQVIRGTYLELSSVLSNTVGVNPFTMATLYRACVLPRALFACEFWNNIARPVMIKLEVASHMCLKHKQNLPHLTRSNMVIYIYL